MCQGLSGEAAPSLGGPHINALFLEGVKSALAKGLGPRVPQGCQC